MPTLIIDYSLPCQCSTAGRSYDNGILVRALAPPNAKAASRRPLFVDARRSAFRELLPTSRLVQPDFLPLDFPRITRHQPGFRQHGLEPQVVVHQCTSDAMTNRPGLARLAAALDVDHDIEARFVIDELQRLPHDHSSRLTREKLIDRLF